MVFLIPMKTKNQNTGKEDYSSDLIAIIPALITNLVCMVISSNSKPFALDIVHIRVEESLKELQKDL